jgi:hypothetical protein
VTISTVKAIATLTAMRRTGLIFTGLVVWLVCTAAPAGAHPFLEPSSGTVGRRGTFGITVDSHFPGSDLTGIELAAPADFRLDSVSDIAGGWERTDTPTSVRFTGALSAGKVVVVRFSGTPLRKGVVVFALTTTSAKGEVIRWNAPCTDTKAPYKGALLFVDVDPGTACDPPPAPRGSAVKSIGLGLVAAGLVIGGAYPVIRRSRERRTSD